MARPYASYRYLRDAATSALLGAIEVYNKPAISYREEAAVILLVNAWELILKAILARAKVSIFYKKRFGQPYRSLALSDAFAKCEENRLFPAGFPIKAVRENLNLLTSYRDNAIHFYNERGFRVVVYSLFQTSVGNFNALLNECVGGSLEPHLPGNLLPLGLDAPVDPLAFIRSVESGSETVNPSVSAFMRQIGQAVRLLEGEGLDTGGLLTVFKVHLVSEKKIASADLVVSVAEDQDASVVVRTQDSNVTHPYRQTEILRLVPTVAGTQLTGYVFQAIVFHRTWKGDIRFHWLESSGAVQKYSPLVVAALKKMTQDEVDDALCAYRRRQKA